MPQTPTLVLVRLVVRSDGAVVTHRIYRDERGYEWRSYTDDGLVLSSRGSLRDLRAVRPVGCKASTSWKRVSP